MHPAEIPIHDFNYHLPNEKIAEFPLPERDGSKLLIYREGQITTDQYRNIANYISPGSMVVFNNTRVIQARMLFQKATGGVVEIFCLEPYELPGEYNIIMNTTGLVRWKCLVGGAGKWKTGALQKKGFINNEAVTLSATLMQRLADAYVVELSWMPGSYTFAEILECFGDMPLPPYIKRKAAAADAERYQTIFAAHKGSVAAPTASLHFTDAIVESFEQKNIQRNYVTLHVGAGTFKPVKAALLSGHEMHSEWMEVSADTIRALKQQANQLIIAAGTTSLRTIETLYWMGIKTMLHPGAGIGQLIIHQWDVYEDAMQLVTSTAEEALNALLQWMEAQQLERIFAPTQILIAPGYRYRIAGALITNFHQPQSTLLLLVAAAVGPGWKKIYDYALQHDFRFLSYGDGSLLFIDRK